MTLLVPVWPVAVIIASLVVALVFLRVAFICARKRADTAEKAYSELTAQSGIRERTLMGERDAGWAAARVRQQHWVRLESAEQDADRLAPIVAQYIKDIDDTALLLKDDKPPALTAEREALRLHLEAVKSRTNP